tara:strand:+ start:164 stop:397 length:234 start_codon:yes stop_codon:yes gene_type:complete
MKVGDLVELSAYGKKLKWYSRGLGLKQEELGILVEINRGHLDSYFVRWNFGTGIRCPHSRKDLKMAKISKKSVANSD